MEKPTTRRAVGGSFETQGTVDLAEFSPSENSSSLIAYGGNLRVSLGSCVFKVLKITLALLCNSTFC